MFGTTSKFAVAALAAVSLTMAGCASRGPAASDGTVGDQSARIAALEASVMDKEKALSERDAQISRLSGSLERRPDVAARGASVAGGDLLPPAAKPGECYARLFVPAEYGTSTETILKREASSRLEIIPARYEMASEQVLVKEASSKLVKVPASYENVSERIIVEPARTEWRVSGGGTGARSKGSALADDALIASASKLGLPASAQPGQCFAEYVKPERFETTTEQVVKREASSRVEVVPAKYEMASEQVLVQEASERIVVVPAVYETVSEKILVKPAYTTWKKGRGAIERLDNATGEIMCLVEVPAEYKTVSKRVLKTAATTKRVAIPAKYSTLKVRKLAQPASERRIDIPAEYQTVSKRARVSDAARAWAKVGSGGASLGKATGRRLCLKDIAAKTKTVTRRVQKTPASTRTVEIPAVYKTVKIRKLAQAAAERRIEIPAEYQKVTKRNLVRDGNLEWRSILCETNTTPQLITDLQRALRQAGHNPGPIDGRFGSQTLSAVKAFQRKKGLPAGNLTLATLDALGVRR